MMQIQIEQWNSKNPKKKIKKVLKEIVILQDGWESDSRGWIVELETSKIIGITTNHGDLIEWPEKEMDEYLEILESCTRDILHGLLLMGKK